MTKPSILVGHLISGGPKALHAPLRASRSRRLTSPISLSVIVVATAMALVTIAGPEAPAQDGPNTLSLKKSCGAFALDPATGSVVGLDPNNDTATLFPKAFLDGKDDKTGEPKKIGGLPVSIVFKRAKDKSYFVVACLRSNELYVLDAKGLDIVKTLKIKGEDLSCLACSLSPADPYVYYTCNRGHESAAGRLNLNDLADEGKVDLAGNQGSSVMDLAVSADGKYIYPRGPWTPSGFAALVRSRDAASGKDAWKEVVYEHDSTVLYLPDPFGFYTAVGEKLYSLDLKKTAATLDFPVVAFFPDRPVVIGLDGTKVTAVSYNSFKKLGDVDLGAYFQTKDDNLSRAPRRPRGRNVPAPDLTDFQFPEVGNPQGDFKHFGYQMAFLADGASERLIVAYGRKITTIPLKSLGVTPEPLLLAKIEAPDSACVGVPITISVQPYNEATKIELKDAPAGMELSGTKLTWTPKSSQVGQVAIELKLSAGGGELRQILRLEVTQPAIHLGFLPQGLAVSPSGKLAVAWASGSGDPLPMMGGEEKDDQSRLALIDLVQKKTLAEKKLLYSITTAAVDDQALYVAPTRSDRLDTLALKDLSSDKRVNTDSAVVGIAFATGKLLFVRTARSLGVYTFPDLKKVEVPALKAPDKVSADEAEMMRQHRMVMGQRNGPDSGMPVRCHGGWLIDGMVFADDLSKVKMLVECPSLPSLAGERGISALSPVAWNRLLTDGSLVSALGGKVSTLSGQAACLMDDCPAVVMLQLPLSEQKKNMASLEVLDLIVGKTVATVPLKEFSDRTQAAELVDAFRNPRGGLIQASGRSIVAAISKDIYVYVLDDETVKALTPPLEFEVPAEVPVIGVKQPTKIAHKIVGGEKPFEYDLKRTQEGVEIDKATGTVTVDGAVLARKAVATLVRGGLLGAGREGSPEADGQADPAKAAAALLKPVKAQYKKLLGGEMAGIPVLLPLSVVVSDKAQQLAQMDYQAVLEVPDEMITKLIADAVAQAKKAEEENRKKQDEYRRIRQAEEEEYARRSGRATQPSDERMEKLEKRVADLEAKIDLLIKLVQPKKE